MARVRGEVTCLNCGRFLGEIESADGRLRLLRRGTGGVAPQVVGGRLRCGRCGGRAVLERNLDGSYAA
jgi:hypothetical protein